MPDPYLELIEQIQSILSEGKDDSHQAGEHRNKS